MWAISIVDLQSFATVAAFVAFIGVGWWAYSPKNKQRFEEDAMLALNDDPILNPQRQQTPSEASASQHRGD